MKSSFDIGGPEIFGMVIVGATVGAVLCGAASTELTMHCLPGAALGSLAFPAIVVTPWGRLLRALPLAQKPARS